MKILPTIAALLALSLPSITYAHKGGCRKSSPPGQCCHVNRKKLLAEKRSRLGELDEIRLKLKQLALGDGGDLEMVETKADQAKEVDQYILNILNLLDEQNFVHCR